MIEKVEDINTGIVLMGDEFRNKRGDPMFMVWVASLNTGHSVLLGLTPDEQEFEKLYDRFLNDKDAAIEVLNVYVQEQKAE